MKQNASQSYFSFLKVGMVLERGVVELFSGGLVAMLPEQSRQFIGSICVLRILCLGYMAGTTRLEPATSAVTDELVAVTN